MSYQLTERPHKFSFSKNPIRYLVEISNPDAPGCALDVELYTIPINEAYTVDEPGELVTRQTLYPNPDGKVYFYVEDFLNSWLEWELISTGDNNIKTVTSQISKYYIRYRQTTKNNPTPPWATESDTLRTVIKGGVAKEKFDRNNFFVNWLPAKKCFLTWQPDKNFIGQEERRYLTYFHHHDSMPDLLLKARVVYTDGTEDSVTIAFPSLEDSLLFHVPAGLDQLGLYGLQPAKQVWYYDVSVEDAASNIYASAYRLYADYRMYYDVFSFTYHNSLGGIDTIRIRGDYDIEINFEKTDIQQATGGDFGEVLPTENAVINISKYEVYKGDAGWMNTKAFQDSCQELLLSDNVFRVVFNRWLRVINMQKAQALRSSDDTKWSFPLQWRYTFDNTQYTPFDKDLGAGVNNEDPGPVYGTCTAPGNLLATFVGESGGEAEYDFTWDAVAGSEGYELEYLPPGAAVWTKVETTDPEATVTFNVEGEYSWRVRNKCGTEDYSLYQNGVGFVIDLSDFVCTAPSALTTVLLSMDSTLAVVKTTWPAVPGVVGYVIETREVGASVWFSAAVTAAEYRTFFHRDKQYEQRVKSKCDELGNYSGYVYGDTFIPSDLLAGGNPPSNLTVVVMPPISGPYSVKPVSFTWTNEPSAVSYQLEYKATFSSTWTIAGNVASGIVILITNGFTYQWRVRSNFAGGGFSGYVAGSNFNT